jgi:PAS domain S-box-containing protein
MSLHDDSPSESEASENRYLLLVQGIKDHAIFMLDRTGHVVTWHAGAERIHGYSANEVLNDHYSRFYDEAAIAQGKPARDLETAVKTGQLTAEGWRVRKDGSRFWADVVISALSDTSGRARGFAVTTRDVSGRRESDEALRSVLDHVIDGIISIDDRGAIQSFNPAAEKLFGYTAAEILGQNVKLLMPEPYHGEHDSYIANYLRTGEAKIIGIGREVIGKRRDGSTFPMDLAVSQYHLHDRCFFTGIVRDITERKRLEQELRRRISELAETDRKKDEFLAMLAHELRNPLAAISNAVQLTGQFGDPEQYEWSAKVINRQIKHLARLIDDLLDVSRITRGKIQLRTEAVDLSTVIENAVESVHPLIDERRQTLTVSVPSGTLWLDADPTRLEQILMNLLNNAAKYTGSGGFISLSATCEGEKVVMRVRDTGIGIAPEKLPQMFELFAQGDRSLARQEGGLGIGLTLARSLAEMHGGSLSAASEGPGKGSEFTLRLPAAGRPGAALGRERPLGPCGIGSRVMVVDDNVELALGLARLLKLLGHDVRIAHDGPTALDSARSFKPEIVLLDIGLPGLDGYQVAMQLRQEGYGRSVRLIAITGYGHEEDRTRSREAGFDHHLVKPIEFRSLVTLLSEPAHFA